jgi:hypothetical protein
MMDDEAVRFELAKLSDAELVERFEHAMAGATLTPQDLLTLDEIERRCLEN